MPIGARPAELPATFTLLISVGFALLTAGLYAYLAWRLHEREISSSEARAAWRSFIIWWICLAGTTLAGGLLNLLGALQVTNLPLFITITHLNLLLSCLALWGVLNYMSYLVTGSSRLFVPLIVFYFVTYAVVLYYNVASLPAAVQVDRWSATLTFDNPIIDGPLFYAVVFMLIVPAILGAFGYMTLYFRVKEITQKYRVMLVSWGAIVWIGGALMTPLTGVTQTDGWQVAGRLVGLSAILFILLAYFPPRWIRERLRIASAGGNSHM